ncbi:hypothetical protein [Parasedimentitalea maritima]|nr:hypothetical protein [Zongyanglinia marina]
MRIVNSGYLTAASLALATIVSTPASADFWWDTREGPLYFDGASGNYGVFYFLDDNNNRRKEVAIYIDGMGPQYTDNHPGVFPGRYGAFWFNYDGDNCETQSTDPDGRVANEWGKMWFTVDQNSDYFTAEVYDCDEQTPSEEFSGTPGT